MNLQEIDTFMFSLGFKLIPSDDNDRQTSMRYFRPETSLLADRRKTSYHVTVDSAQFWHDMFSHHYTPNDAVAAANIKARLDELEHVEVSPFNLAKMISYAGKFGGTDKDLRVEHLRAELAALNLDTTSATPTDHSQCVSKKTVAAAADHYFEMAKLFETTVFGLMPNETTQEIHFHGRWLQEEWRKARKALNLDSGTETKR